MAIDFFDLYVVKKEKKKIFLLLHIERISIEKIRIFEKEKK